MGAFHDMVTNSGFQIPTQGPEASLALSRSLVTFSPFPLFRSIVSMSERFDSFFIIFDLGVSCKFMGTLDVSWRNGV
jgi:hypothetical protein